MQVALNLKKMSKKIVIDKDFLLRLKDAFINPDTLDYILENATEIDTDQSIEERAENKAKIIESEHYYHIVKEAIIQAATEQDLISKAREGEFSKWCSVNGWYFYSKDNIWRKHGSGGFEYKTTEELFNQFTNK